MGMSARRPRLFLDIVFAIVAVLVMTPEYEQDSASANVAEEVLSPDMQEEAVVVARPPVVASLSAGGVVVGSSRCRPCDPGFRFGGRFGGFCLAFPKLALWIQPEHHPRFVADSTKVTLYGPNEEFERRAIDPAGGQADWILFSTAIVEEVFVGLRILPRASDEISFDRPYVNAPASMHLAQRCLHDAVGHGSRDFLYVEEAAITLLATALAAPDGEHPNLSSGECSRRHYDLVQATCAHLGQTSRQNQSLKSIATAVGASVFHLSRVFRRVTGLTIHRYRNELRLRDAVVALENSNQDLLTIALASGYSGHSHFTAAFRQAFGVTPSGFREQRGERLARTEA
jgi:AraC family transcriptional regulator